MNRELLSNIHDQNISSAKNARKLLRRQSYRNDEKLIFMIQWQGNKWCLPQPNNYFTYLTSFDGRNSNESLYDVSTCSFRVWVSLNLSPSTLKKTGEESSNLVMWMSILNALSSVLEDAILEEWFVGRSRN